MINMCRMFPVLLCLLVCAVGVNGVSYPYESLDGITIYGEVNATHMTPLPNYDVSGSHLHYVLNNLPITNTSGSNQTLRTVTIIFFANSDPAIASQNLPHQVTLHVARPTDGSDPTSPTRRLQYVTSVLLDNIVSGQEIDVSAQNIQFQAGDLLALSVPNNAINLRVGVNNVGLPVGYASAVVPKGTADDTFAGIFVNYPNAANSNPIQICVAFTSSSPAPPSGLCFRGDNVFFTTPLQQVQHDGNIVQVSVGCTSGIYAVGWPWEYLSDGSVTHAGTSLTLRIKLWRGGDALISNTQGGFVTNVDQIVTAQCGKSVNIQTIPVKAGDYVLFSVPSSDSPLCVPQSSTIFTNAFSVISSTGKSIVGAPFYHFPAFQFGFVEQGGVIGDPQFAGFQGQSYQFHGLPDEVFNLISSPQLQLNTHFVYLAHGTCDYNDTLCFQHPGTYLDVLGFTIPTNKPELPHAHIRVVAGSHRAGLRVWTDMEMDDEQEEQDEDNNRGDMDDDAAAADDDDDSKSASMKEIKVGSTISWIMDNATETRATLRYHKHGRITVETHLFRTEVTNSNYFFNLGVALLDGGMLRAGHEHHTITDRATCQHDQHGHAVVKEDKHDHGTVEAQLMKKYHVQYPVHGLVGQTWRNVLVCGKAWMGSVQDYLVSDLFGSDYFYNFYKQ